MSRTFIFLVGLLCGSAGWADTADPTFPPPLESYTGEEGLSFFQVLVSRVRQEPLNLIATLIFAFAILHTFLAPRITRLAHELDARDTEHSFKAEAAHLFGEVEAVFGIWVVPVLVVITLARGWHAAESFVEQVDFTEPAFVVAIMAIASTRPVMSFAERTMGAVAGLFGGTPLAWWISILTLGPLLGSLITEPAAMTICALLLARYIYSLGLSRRLAYGTLGLLFVDVSVGGTLTHFAAPPVLIVAEKFGWGTVYMLRHFGWKAILGIVVANALYALFFRTELRQLAAKAAEQTGRELDQGSRIPAPVTLVHLGLLGWTVLTAHTPVLFIGGLLFLIAFMQATAPYQSELRLGPPVLVGFFLGGLVIHGSLQQWWIEPLLSRLTAIPLFAGAMILTAFNDNAAITYLASLVPGLTEDLKYAVVSGAMAAGGLTVIANAPNPAGQAILGRFFPAGVAPGWLFLGAAIPTLILAACFLLLT
jgi:Putative Na+/H+ antiporter